jgi:hypothetical protein
MLDHPRQKNRPLDVYIFQILILSQVLHSCKQCYRYMSIYLFSRKRFTLPNGVFGSCHTLSFNQNLYISFKRNYIYSMLGSIAGTFYFKRFSLKDIYNSFYNFIFIRSPIIKQQRYPS